MKARIKLVEQTFNREIRSGDIVDIEIYGEPKAFSPDLGMELEETLKEKFIARMPLGMKKPRILSSLLVDVAIDKVLKVFDSAIDDIPSIRKAIEDMKG